MWMKYNFTLLDYGLFKNNTDFVNINSWSTKVSSFTKANLQQVFHITLLSYSTHFVCSLCAAQYQEHKEGGPFMNIPEYTTQTAD